MRSMIALALVLFGFTMTGCGQKRPDPPADYVDPGTDPKAMGDELKAKP
ncbi:MAG: hypothetical protein AB7F89_19505 [Pirellulaceae bacterium]